MKKNTVILTAALISAFTASTALADTTMEFRKAVEDRGGYSSMEQPKQKRDR